MRVKEIDINGSFKEEIINKEIELEELCKRVLNSYEHIYNSKGVKLKLFIHRVVRENSFLGRVRPATKGDILQVGYYSAICLAVGEDEQGLADNEIQKAIWIYKRSLLSKPHGEFMDESIQVIEQEIKEILEGVLEDMLEEDL